MAEGLSHRFCKEGLFGLDVSVILTEDFGMDDPIGGTICFLKEFNGGPASSVSESILGVMFFAFGDVSMVVYFKYF